MRFSHKDFEALQRAILELYEYRDLVRFKREVPRIFLNVFRAEYASYDEYELNPAGGKVRLVEYWESEKRMSSQTVQLFESRILEHPFTRYFMEGRELSALKMSDFFTMNQFKNSQFYGGIFGHLGVDSVLSVPVAGARSTAAMSVCRRNRDFTERDRLMLNLLRPHFNRAWRNAALATERRAAQAKPLLAYGLTPRETEITHWMSQGKMNPEIAIILDMSVRTVEKHMERVLEKLGAENRTAAAITLAAAYKEPNRV
jgi:DNA-binding CsgD family transcriptional regulator